MNRSIFYICMMCYYISYLECTNLYEEKDTTSVYKHTKTYLEWKSGTFFHEDFFSRDTYLGHYPKLDPCTVLTKNQYIKLLKDNGGKCSGKWCIDGEWKCRSGDSQECYNLEHIIDSKNSDTEFGPSFNKNILGNYIFAYGRWNQEIGRIKDWSSIKNEKKEVYGKDIFDRAYQTVYECHKGYIEKEETNLNGILYIIVICGVWIAIFAFFRLREEQKKIVIEDEELKEFSLLDEEQNNNIPLEDLEGN